ncbi:MAG: cation transporter [Rhizobiales bacterium]|nr:cation transporter [Hyphomicrobiales bacterium]
MSHDHHHDHGFGGHAHGPANYNRAFAIGIALNIGFVVIEALYGFIANSMALLADAGHNLSDVLGLVIAWGASLLARRPPSERYTYGLRSTSILAALLNAVFLLVATGGIAWEAIQRFAEPAPVAGRTVIIVAAIGIAINAITAWLFASGRKGDINIKGAYLHMAADAAVSAGVVVAGAVILLTGWGWVDPAVSLVIAAIIVWGTWGLFRESMSMTLGAVPAAIDAAKVKSYLAGLPGVAQVHDLHIWSMSTTETALTAHLVMPAGTPGDAFLTRVAEDLSKQFAIAHPTIQIEYGDGCRLAPDTVV